jgi:GNAT superfamily N-acetyltransferase
MSATLRIKQVLNRRELRQFIYLPAQIHKNHEKWVPPIYMDEWKYFNLKKNRYTAYCDAVPLLVYKGDEAVGRIMGIINHQYNQTRNELMGRFAYLECWNEQDIAHLLLHHAEQWARERGMKRMVGPLGFSDQDPEGFLTEGFEYAPTLATYFNYPYIIQLLENEGYQKEVDYVVYMVSVPDKIPSFYQKIYRRATRFENFQLIEFTSRRQIKPYIKPVFLLMNECFSDLYGFIPLDTAEMKDLAKKFLPIIDPRFVKIVIKDDDVVGFIIGVPNMSEGIRRSKGYLFPVGIFHIFRSAKKTKQLDLLLGGVKEQYRGVGLDVLLGLKTIESAQKAGYDIIDSHHELESNKKMRAEMERMGGQLYKRYRIFKKNL